MQCYKVPINSQSMLNNLVRDLNLTLTKDKAEIMYILGSRLKQGNLLEKGTKISKFKTPS